MISFIFRKHIKVRINLYFSFLLNFDHWKPSGDSAGCYIGLRVVDDGDTTELSQEVIFFDVLSVQIMKIVFVRPRSLFFLFRLSPVTASTGIGK